MRVQNLKFVALPVSEIIGDIQIIWAVPGYAHAPFSPKYFMGFCSDVPVNVLAKFEVRSFTRSWDNSDLSFVWGLRTHNRGEDEFVGGRGCYPSKER